MKRRALIATSCLVPRATPLPLETVDTVEEYMATEAGRRVADVRAAAVGAGVVGVSDSDDTTDEAPEKRAPVRQRQLVRRGKALVRDMVAKARDVDGLVELTELELRSVSGPTREMYMKYVREFCAWSGLSGSQLADERLVDEEATGYMNHLFGQGVKAWRGEKLVAGLCFYSRCCRLPRSIRCLKGWQKASPSQSRRPLALPVWAGLAVEMVRLGHALPAVMTLIMMECYLRPGEMLSLTPASFLGPAPSAVKDWVVLLFPQEKARRSKVGESDDTIALDSGRFGWLQHVCRELAGRRPRDKPLMTMSYGQFLSVFGLAAANLNIEAVPYQARHSGASIDRAEGRRSLESCQKRGRWASFKSVRRYEKHGRLNQTWNELSPEVKAHCEMCLRIIEGVVLRGEPCPLPPSTGGRASRGGGPRRRSAGR